MTVTYNSSKWDISSWNSVLAHPLIVIDVILFIYVISGVVGNATVVYVYSLRLKIRMDDRFFILVLGVMDMIVCTINPAFSLWRNIVPVNSRGNVACKIAWFTTRTMSTSSGLLILVIAIQRYLKVCRPFGPQMTTKLKKASLSLTIFVSMIMHIPLFIFYGEVQIHNQYLNVTGSRCGLLQDVSSSMTKFQYLYFYFMFGSAVLVMLGIVGLYTLTGKKILRQVRRNERRRMSTYTGTMRYPSSYSVTETDSPNSPAVATNVSTVANNVSTVANNASTTVSSTNDITKASTRTKSLKRSRNPLQKHRYSLMFMLIAAVCVVTYVPALTANLLVNVDSAKFWTDKTEVQRSGFLFLFQLYILNHVVNPFIYGLFDGTFRKEVSKLCCKFISKDP